MCSDIRVKTTLLCRALIEIGTEYKCVKCNTGKTYNNLPIVLEIDHIDENWKTIEKKIFNLCVRIVIVKKLRV